MSFCLRWFMFTCACTATFSFRMPTFCRRIRIRMNTYCDCVRIFAYIAIFSICMAKGKYVYLHIHIIFVHICNV